MIMYFGLGSVLILFIASLLSTCGNIQVSADNEINDESFMDTDPEFLHVTENEVTCSDCSKQAEVESPINDQLTTDPDHNYDDDDDDGRYKIVTEQPHTLIEPPTELPPATPPTNEATPTSDEEALESNTIEVDEIETTPPDDEITNEAMPPDDEIMNEATHPDDDETTPSDNEIFTEATPTFDEEMEGEPIIDNGMETTPTDNEDIETTPTNIEMEEGGDDVPTFTEFSQRKRMEQDSSQKPTTGDKLGLGSTGNNNYASLDCGAKIVDANREAQNPSAILSENRDVYMINPCSVDIWFIVELCELVELHSLQIACFELFSSIPKSFNVFVSERYPSDEWRFLGTMIASNERDIQSFPLVLDESNYAKYLRVEMISHYGNEHFCPLSLLRVIGASMMEVYEYSESQQELQLDPPSLTVPPYELLHDDDIFGEGLDINISTEESERVTSLPSILAGVVLSLLETVSDYINQNNKDVDQKEPSLHTTADYTQDTTPISTESVLTDLHQPDLTASYDDSRSDNIDDVMYGTGTEEMHGTGTVQSEDHSTTYTEVTAESPVHSEFNSETHSIPSSNQPETTTDHIPPTPTPSVVPLSDHTSEDMTTTTMGDPSDNNGQSIERGTLVTELEDSSVVVSSLTDNDSHVISHVIKDTMVTTDNMEDNSLASSDDNDDNDVSIHELVVDSTICDSISNTVVDDPTLDIDDDDDKLLHHHKLSELPTINDEIVFQPMDGEREEGKEGSDDEDWLVVVNTENIPETTSEDHSGPPNDHSEPQNDHSGPLDEVQSDSLEHEIENIVSDDNISEGMNVDGDHGNGGNHGDVGDGIRSNDTDETHDNTHDEGMTNGNGAGVLSGQQKEKSVFLRLSNRIRDLEENMSLFSSYLDQISTGMKRNKNKTEDWQRSLEKKVHIMNDSIQLVTNQTELALAVLVELYEDIHSINETIIIMSNELHQMRREGWIHNMVIIVLLLALIGLLALTLIVWLLCNMTRSHDNHVINNHTQRMSRADNDHSHVTGSNGHVTGSNQLPLNGISKSFHITNKSGLLGTTTNQHSLESHSDSLLHTEPWNRVARKRKRKPKTL